MVWKGFNAGIFDNWDDARQQVTGFEGARFKAFATEAEAREAFQQGAPAFSRRAVVSQPVTAQPIAASIAVDAACSGNPGVMEYRGVAVWNNQQIFHFKCELGTNNIGEFLAIVHALSFLKKMGHHELPIYTDSQIAIGWVRHKKCKTKLDQTYRTVALFDLIHRAEKWLEENSYANPILKWPTDKWGEIPADFGRK